MTDPDGPVFTGSVEEFAVTEGGREYRICYLPDTNNEALQKEGKPPHFYWIPGEVRLARDHEGHYKFSLLKYQGELGEDTHSGIEGDQSLAGGVLSLTTTSRPPDGVLESAHQQLIDRYRGADDSYWGIRTDAAPQIGVVPVAENQTSISNVSPDGAGSVPGMADGEAEERAVMADGERPASTGATADGGQSGVRERPPSGAGSTGARPGDSGSGDSAGAGTDTGDSTTGSGPVAGPPVATRRLISDERPVADTRAAVERSGVDMWHERMDGEGSGSLDPAAENAFAGSLGPVPTAILWEGFKGQYSPMMVTQWMRIPVWSESINLRIEGEWERIHDHFSAHAQGRAFWASADVKYELDKLIQNGDITVELSIDGTRPSAGEHEEAVRQRLDLILKKFQERAEDVIFRPPEDVEAATAPKSKTSIFSPYGAGLALKKKKDVTTVTLSYEETVEERYLYDHVIDGTLRGFYDEIQDDPRAEDRYFRSLFLGEHFRTVERVFRPVANWGDRARGLASDPISFMEAQVGYPMTTGDVEWRPVMYDPGEDEPKKISVSRKPMDDVENPPAEWSPDETFVKRRIHFDEPPGPTEYPYTTVQIEREIADLDPGERGTLTSDIAHEIRADNAGALVAGPMSLNVSLENEDQYVEVAFKADGETLDGGERGWVRLAWHHDDQDEPRFWKLFTGDPEYVPSYTYQVRVVVKGTIFESGKEWLGPEETVVGNGPLQIRVPTPDEAVESRSLTSREVAGLDPIRSILDDRSAEMEDVPVREAETTDSAALRPPSTGKPLSEHADGGETADADHREGGVDGAVPEGDAGDAASRHDEPEAIKFTDVAGWTVE